MLGPSQKWRYRAGTCRPFKETRNRFPTRRAGTTTLFFVPGLRATYIGEINSSESIPGLHKRLKIPALIGIMVVVVYTGCCFYHSISQSWKSILEEAYKRVYVVLKRFISNSWSHTHAWYTKVGIDNSKCIDSLLLSIEIFVTKLVDKCIVFCLSYSIFFDKFIALKITVSIILKKSLSKNFYAMLLSIQIFVTKLFDKCIILCLSHSIFFDKFIAFVRHVTGNDQDYLRKIPRVVVQKSALL